MVFDMFAGEFNIVFLLKFLDMWQFWNVYQIQTSNKIWRWISVYYNQINDYIIHFLKWGKLYSQNYYSEVTL